MAERLGSLGYFALKVEAAKGTPLTPTDYIPLFSENMMTKLNLVEDNPAVGQKYGRFQVLPGHRGHVGEVTVLAEPNTTARLFDMLLNKTGTSGGGPYTHAFALNSTNPKSYTVDISTGNRVIRFMGFELSSIKPVFEGSEARWSMKASALKSLAGRRIASVSVADVVLDTDYDPNPTVGFVASDLVQIYDVSAGTYQNFTISSITPATNTITLSGSPSGIVAGDVLELRPATPSLTLRTPFLSTRTEFRFADTAANALTATQTRVEPGSEFEVLHPFDGEEGSKRYGAADPQSLIRLDGDLALKVKKFFDTPEESQYFMGLSARALVIRMFSESGYECRITFNDIRVRSGGDKPAVKTGETLYYELEYAPVYKSADGQAFDVKVLNALATI